MAALEKGGNPNSSPFSKGAATAGDPQSVALFCRIDISQVDCETVWQMGVMPSLYLTHLGRASVVMVSYPQVEHGYLSCYLKLETLQF